MYKKTPPQGNVLLDVWKCIWVSVSLRYNLSHTFLSLIKTYFISQSFAWVRADVDCNNIFSMYLHTLLCKNLPLSRGRNEPCAEIMKWGGGRVGLAHSYGLLTSDLSTEVRSKTSKLNPSIIPFSMICPAFFYQWFQQAVSDWTRDLWHNLTLSTWKKAPLISMGHSQISVYRVTKYEFRPDILSSNFQSVSAFWILTRGLWAKIFRISASLPSIIL